MFESIHIALLSELTELTDAGFYKHRAPNGAKTRTADDLPEIRA